MSSSSSHAPAKSVFHFIQKRFLSSPSSVAALAVASPLVHDEQSESSVVTRKTLVQLNPNTSAEKHASVIDFFKSFGFPDAHIAKIVAKKPLVLRTDAEKILKSKFDCLVEYGVFGSSLHDLIVTTPIIMKRGLNTQLLPTLRLLHAYLGSNERVALAVTRNPWLLSYGNNEILEKSFIYLASEGMPVEIISKLIFSRVCTIAISVDKTVRAFKTAKEFGFRPTDPMIVCAFEGIFGMSESTMSRKIEIVRYLLGLSEEEIKYLFKRDPRFFSYSEEKMKKVADFFVNTVRVESSFLRYVPYYFSHSVEKRLVPRYNVYKILESRKLLTKGVKFTSLLKRSEDWFQESYVDKYLDKVPNLMELYRGCTETSKSVSSATKFTEPGYPAEQEMGAIKIEICTEICGQGICRHPKSKELSYSRSD